MCHKETKEILNANDLLALMETDLDKDALKKCTEEFNANGLPKYEEKDEPETEAKLYGYFLDMGMKKRAEEFVRDDV